MSEARIIFTFNGIKTTIQCNKNEKMRNILKRYATKIQIDINKVYLLYNGNKLDEELNFEELANKEDKLMNMMNIILYEINKSTIIEEKIKKSKEIICPKCKENILIEIKDYKKNKKDIYKNRKSHSNKSNNLLRANHTDKSPSKKERKNNLNFFSPKYKKDLFDIFCEFLDKNKFKLSNNFDERNSKKFLDKKDKCLERIILSDIIEEEKEKQTDLNMKKKKKFGTQKNMHQYFIVISNYDEEMEKKAQQRKSLKPKKFLNNKKEIEDIL